MSMRDIYLKKGLLVVFLFVFAVGSYFVTGHMAAFDRAVSLKIFVDELIPFMPWTVLLYSCHYTSMLYPLFIIKDYEYFLRTVKAYTFIVAVHSLIYLVFPVTSNGFRPNVDGIDTSLLYDWAVRLTFFVDPPINLFPSMHLSIACMAFISVYKLNRRYGMILLPVVTGIGISILTMKQHYIVDGIGAIVLAWWSYHLFQSDYDLENKQPQQLVYGNMGPLLYFLFHAIFYLSVSVLHLWGWKPW